MKVKTKNPLRCVCSRQPLLAYYGKADNDKPYVHVKVYKQSKVYGEMLVTDGTCHLLCRECYRWTRIRLATETVAQDVGVPRPLAG